MPHISTFFRDSRGNKDLLHSLGQVEDLPPAYHKTTEELDQRRYDGRDLPIVAVAVYKNDVLVLRQGEVKSGPGGLRKEIKMLTDDSLRRLAFVANNCDRDFRSMITVTYPNMFPTNGEICKAHLDRLLKALKRKLGNDLAYLWFLEFQKRGAPHFHILLQVGLVYEESPELRQWLSKTWYKIVDSGDDLHLLAGTNWENVRETDGLSHYVTKYCAKTYQKQVPEGFWNVGRFWGNSRNLIVMPVLLVAGGESVIKDNLKDWPHADVLAKAVPRVLFNASKFWASIG